jgi:hypothetical protein
MSLQRRSHVNRWDWYPPGSFSGSVRISKPEDSTVYELNFEKPKVFYSVDELQDFIDSLQSIVGPRPDKHVAFPEVTEQGVGTDGIGPPEDVT